MRSGKVYMQKTCPEHGQIEVLIENNAEFYQKLYNPHPPLIRSSFENLSIPVSYDCNLKCQICYMSPLPKENVSLEEIKHKIRQFSGKMIWITGGEPTLNDQLIDIIVYIIAQGKVPVLITNGLKFSDMTYLKRLKSAGLEWIHFSFNGFNDQAYQQVNEKAMFGLKKQALRNLKKLKMFTALSFLYVAGVNDTELKQVVCFCLRNHSFIRQLRIRVATQNGRSINTESVFLSDLVAQVAKVFRIKAMDLCEQALYAEQVLAGQSYCLQHMPCHLEFDCAKLLSEDKISGRMNFLELSRIFGVFNAVHIIKEHYFKARRRFSFFIKLRVWPDKNSIDLDEIKHCVSAYSVRGSSDVVPFCEAIVRNGLSRNL